MTRLNWAVRRVWTDLLAPRGPPPARPKGMPFASICQAGQSSNGARLAQFGVWFDSSVAVPRGGLGGCGRFPRPA